MTHRAAALGGAESPSRRLGTRRLAAIAAQLDPRDHAVLATIADLHYATTGQLRRRHFAALLAPDRAAQRCLTRLHALGLIERLHRRIGGVRAGSDGHVWRVSHAGARLVGLDPSRRREPGLAHLAHVLAVAELVVQVHEHARTHRVDVVAVETEPACWRRYLSDGGLRPVLLKPDLRLTLGVGNMELHWFVEIDRGTEHRPVLARKVAAYVAAWHDGGEETLAGVFPGVAWVVPDEQRADVVRQVCGTGPDGMFTVTTTEHALDVLTGTGRAT